MKQAYCEHLTYLEGTGVWVFASAIEFHLHERAHHGACAYEVHCRKTSYPGSCTPANTQQETQSYVHSWATQRAFAPLASCLFLSSQTTTHALLKATLCSSQLGLTILHLTHAPLTLKRVGSWLASPFSHLPPCPILGIKPRAWQTLGSH